MSGSIFRADGEGEKRWFYGGGVHTWKLTAEDTNGAFFFAEDNLDKGKTTPLHRHADHDELIYVIEGEILHLSDGVERTIKTGGMIYTPRGVAHAFTVVSEKARIIFMQTPGSGQTFYRTASEPAGDAPGPVDFKRLNVIAKETGVMDLLGPPPFKKA